MIAIVFKMEYAAISRDSPRNSPRDFITKVLWSGLNVFWHLYRFVYILLGPAFVGSLLPTRVCNNAQSTHYIHPEKQNKHTTKANINLEVRIRNTSVLSRIYGPKPSNTILKAPLLGLN